MMSGVEGSRTEIRTEPARAEPGGGWWSPALLALVLRVESLVAAACDMSPGELRTEKRGNDRAAHARQVVIYLLHTRLGLTFSEAGACYDRDRTTAAHACRAVEMRRDDLRFDAAIERFERAVDLLSGLKCTGGRETRE